MNLSEFWQISPQGAKQLRHLSSCETNRRKKRAISPMVVGVNAAAITSDGGPAYANTLRLAQLSPMLKSFRIDASIQFGPQMNEKYVIPAGSVQADQGSEANIISGRLVNKLSIPA